MIASETGQVREKQGWLVAEVTRVAPLNRVPQFAGQESSRGNLNEYPPYGRVSLCGGRSLVRSVPDIPWGNAQLEN
jgi:hypothetical protein